MSRCRYQKQCVFSVHSERGQGLVLRAENSQIQSSWIGALRQQTVAAIHSTKAYDFSTRAYGYLFRLESKASDGADHTAWTRLWCVVDSDDTLRCYPNQRAADTGPPLDQLDLSEARVRMVANDTYLCGGCFSVTSPGTRATWVLATDDEQHALEWVSCMLDPHGG